MHPLTIQQKNMLKNSLCRKHRSTLSFFTVLLKGNLVEERLKDSFTKLVERHEALRTTIIITGENKEQFVDNKKFNLLLIHDGKKQKLSIRSIKEALFNCDNENFMVLFNACLIKIEDKVHILAIAIDHLVSDGRSIEILVNELCGLYNNKPIPELGAQYSEYALSQKKWIDSIESKSAEFFLRKRLIEICSINYRFDYRKNGGRRHGVLPQFHIADKLVSGLKKASENCGSSLHILFLSIFHFLIARWTGERKIAVASMVSGRNNAKYKNTIGYFASYIITFVDIPDQAEIEDIYRIVIKDFLACHASSELTFESNEWLNLPMLNFSTSQQECWSFDDILTEKTSEILIDHNPEISSRNSPPIALFIRPSARGGLEFSFKSLNQSIDINILCCFSDDFRYFLQKLIL